MNRFIYDPKMKEARGNFKKYDLSGWEHSIQNGTEMIYCPRCGSGIILELYLSALGTAGTRFCPYCGDKREK